ncbi:hypothetical protein [Corynebacterium epidermidicanis]|uniref:hypothetical protein n=1 Tax=Corynebacterium epidermidicanis TaxID=1050174 RepID=UPI00130EED02|nr:hypothetical protein [Corynebacterium epidermidicanis]
MTIPKTTSLKFAVMRTHLVQGIVRILVAKWVRNTVSELTRTIQGIAPPNCAEVRA